jgi:hypothetical protein
MSFIIFEKNYAYIFGGALGLYDFNYIIILNS